jgi:Response regulator of the LytR/AlgR family
MECYIKLELNEIYYITKKKGKVVIITKDSSIETSSSLFYMNEMLRNNMNFFRCHKCFIINLNKINNITKYNNKTYNISFKGIDDVVYITQKNLKILTERISIL